MIVKRIGALLLAALLCFGVWGCSTQPSQSAVVPGHKTIGLCVRQKSDAPEYYETLAAGLRELGCGVLLEDCQGSQSRQDDKVQYLVTQGCNLLIVEPVMVSAMDTVIARAKEAQLPVIVLDRQPEQSVMDSYEGLYYVGCDSAQAGAEQAKLLDRLSIRGDLNGDGIVSYMILRGPQDHMDAQLITDACNEALAQQDTELLCVQSAQWSSDDGRAQCAQALSRFGRDIEVIFCNDALLAQGAVEAVKNGGWIPGQDVYILGIGTNTQLKELIGQGAVAATVMPDSAQRMQMLVETARMLLNGQTPETYSYVPFTALNEDG